MLCGDLNGKEIPKRGLSMDGVYPSIYLPFYIFTYIYLIHFDVQQKLIHHCKATPLQYQKALHCRSGDDKEMNSVISKASEHSPVSSSGGGLLKHGLKSENHREEGSDSQQWQDLSCACYSHLQPESPSPATSLDELCW